MAVLKRHAISAVLADRSAFDDESDDGDCEDAGADNIECCDEERQSS